MGAGEGDICHEEERKEFCWQFRVRDKWRKVKGDCLIFFWDGGVGRSGFSHGGFGLGVWIGGKKLMPLSFFFRCRSAFWGIAPYLV